MLYNEMPINTALRGNNENIDPEMMYAVILKDLSHGKQGQTQENE